MQQPIQAIYEKGVLRPLQPLDLAEQELVSLAIERAGGQARADKDPWLDDEAIRNSSLLADPSVTLADVREALRGIQGDLADAVSQQRGDF